MIKRYGSSVSQDGYLELRLLMLRRNTLASCKLLLHASKKESPQSAVILRLNNTAVVVINQLKLLFMAKHNTEITYLKNKILFLTYVYRSLPVLYINRILNEPKQTKIIHRLEVDYGLISKKTTLHGLDFITLTNKGYRYLTQEVLKTDHEPMYRNDPFRSIRKNVSEHSFMNFVYIWNYVSRHPEHITNALRIYEDTNMKYCRVKFSYHDRYQLLVPDVMVAGTQSKGVVFVENDTGREEHAMIYRKVVEYAAYAKNADMPVRLLFVMHSPVRMRRLFFEQSGMVRFFDEYNHSEKLKQVPIEDILQSLQSEKLTIAVSWLDRQNMGNSDSFENYDLLSLLVAKKPVWRHLI